MAVVTRTAGLALLGVTLWCHAASAQALQADDPLPPGTTGEVRTLTGQVLDLKATVLDLKATGLDVRRLGADTQGRVLDIGR